MKVFILIRHAEKEDSKIDNHSLSSLGYDRSSALVEYFKTLPYKITGLISQGVDENGKGKSKRPTQTLIPFSKDSGLEITEFTKSKLVDMVEHVRNLPDEECVVVCWSHNDLPKIARLLGATDAPEKWKGYNQTWIIEKGENSVMLKLLNQKIMASD